MHAIRLSKLRAYLTGKSDLVRLQKNVVSGMITFMALNHTDYLARLYRTRIETLKLYPGEYQALQTVFSMLMSTKSVELEKNSPDEAQPSARLNETPNDQKC